MLIFLSIGFLPTAKEFLQVNYSMPYNANSSRRDFIAKSVGAIGATAFVKSASAESAHPAVHNGVDETIRVGLVGCGGRGQSAVVDALEADSNAKLVAVGDAFADRVDLCLGDLRADPKYSSRVDVSPEQVYTGFDNYRGVIDACDVVLLASPPHFRPEQLEYAVEKGKHAFVEKPVAVDAPGVRSVMQSCRVATEKRLSIVSGLCWRYHHGVRETMRRLIDDRAIGDIVAIESTYNSGALWHRGDRPDWSRMEYQMRNWLYFTWLSGDHILEQAVHSIDKTAWLLGDIQPTSAMGMGGRQQRTDAKYGHIYDHFTVFYEYPTGQHVYFTCRQQDGTTNRVDERVLGTEGSAEILRHRIESESNGNWRYKGPKPSMYRVEQQELFASIRSGEPINNGHYMCNSTMIGLMGRMAAYTGKTVSWEDCLNSKERLGPQSYAWGDAPSSSVATPGVNRT